MRFSALRCFALFAVAFPGLAAEIKTAPLPVVGSVVVEGNDLAALVGPYHQPRWSARGRFSADTDVYVLPPFEAFLDLDYELIKPRHDETINLFTQELEMGLPHRLQLAYEHAFEVRDGRTEETMHAIEGRWALANWGKLPLNPTLFAEYKFGVGHESAEAEEADGEDAEERSASQHRPDAFEVRLLLGEQFGEKTLWALNLFHEQETGGAREHETGFSQALTYGLLDETLRVGMEMEYIHSTEAGERSAGKDEFDIGPSLSYKPNKRVRFDVAALFGCTQDSPEVRLFAVLSINLGSVSDNEIATPVSTQNR